MPLPESCTPSSRYGAVTSEVHTVTFRVGAPPFAAAVIALVRRFKITCWICTGSPYATGRAAAGKNSMPTERRKAVKTMVLVAIVSLVIAAGAADSAAQMAGSTLISTEELREVATGWSAKKQIRGKDVYNDTGEKIVDINDLMP